MFNFFRKKKITNNKWKEKIDRTLESRQNSQKLKEKLEFEKKVKIKQAERDIKVKKLGETFKCHICKRPAMEPYVGRRNIGEYTVDLTENWDEPGDLRKCSECHELTCNNDDCVHKGICKECAEKM